MSTVLEKPVLLDETGQDIVDKLDEIKTAIGSTGEFIPVMIKVTTPPTKTSYFAGDTLDLTGMVVTLYASNGLTFDVTGDCTFNPANGATLTSQDTSVAISYTWHETQTTFTASQPIQAPSVQSIEITTPPTKTNYKKGEQLNLSGIVVKANLGDNTQIDITSDCTFSPSNGSTLSTIGTINVTAQLVAGGQSYTATQAIIVAVTIVTWANGTDEEVAEMLQAHYDGDISIHDYWSVGDERTVTLAAMEATGVGESYPETTVTLVLMNAGGKTLSDGTTECAFVVGVKEVIGGGYMNSTDTNSGGWRDCARRTWCNSVFYNAVPSAIRSIFKQFKNMTGTGGGSSSGTYDTTDYFALPAEIEVFGTATYSVAGEGTQFKYYETTANIVKLYANTSRWSWWERSPSRYGNNTFCNVAGTSTPSSSTYLASTAYGISPFGCI